VRIEFDVQESPSEVSTPVELSDVLFITEDLEPVPVAVGRPGIFWVVEGIIPPDRRVSFGDYLRFRTTLSEGGIWSLIDAASGGSIDASTGLYRAGSATGTDLVQVLTNSGTATAQVTVSEELRAQGGPGPATSLDVTGGGVGLDDVILLLRYAVGLENPAPDVTAAGDFDCDGRIGINDVLNAIRVFVGLEPILSGGLLRESD